MDDNNITIAPIPTWKADPGIDEDMKETHQPAIVIIGGMMYILNNALATRKVDVVGGKPQCFNFGIYGYNDKSGIIGKEVFIGVEKMEEIIEQYKEYDANKTEGGE